MGRPVGEPTPVKLTRNWECRKKTGESLKRENEKVELSRLMVSGKKS